MRPAATPFLGGGGLLREEVAERAVVHPGVAASGAASSEMCARESREVVAPLRAVSPPASAISAPPQKVVKVPFLEVRGSSAMLGKEGTALFATVSLAVNGSRGIGVRTGGELSRRFCALKGRGARA